MSSPLSAWVLISVLGEAKASCPLPLLLQLMSKVSGNEVALFLWSLLLKHALTLLHKGGLSALTENPLVST